MKFFTQLFDANVRTITQYKKTVDGINKLEDEARKLSLEELKSAALQLRNSVQNDGKTVEEVVPWAFAIIREAARKALNMRHYDVQLVAALALSKGAIAEQKTGEGKTLTATAALFLHALSGKGAHLVTVNDYLVRLHAGWMGHIFNALGFTTGAIIHDESFMFDITYFDPQNSDWRLTHLRPVSRGDAYAADITYGVNSEFGFDYLRDNMANSVKSQVQRGFNFAIVDEADSVLIDEARTPHIISAPVEDDPRKFVTIANLVRKLESDTDYKVDEKLRTANLTDAGIRHIEELLGVSNVYEKDYDTLFYIEAGLKALTLFKRDKDYIVQGSEVVIVDEFTGRLLPGRRYSDGLHQAIEAKEGVAIQRESKTLATVSLQNYFRQYTVLSGMTGTASTEAEEFHKIYHIDTLVIPTHLNNVRKDMGDEIYKTNAGKYQAIAKEVARHNKEGRPVLVGTTSIENNELLSSYLTKMGTKHILLNAKNHQKEGEIIANAGKVGNVVVATNMAGRGVDIILGGNPPEKPKDDANEKELETYNKEKELWQNEHDTVVKLGGLVVLGTERHESRRIDNQLRGRSGRQGDPGETKFFISLDDELMRIFGGDRLQSLFNSPLLNVPEDMALSHPMVSNVIEQSQIKVEGHNFDIRKHLVDYDDVLSKQRSIVYAERTKLLQKFTSKDDIKEISSEIIHRVLLSFVTDVKAIKPNATVEQKEYAINALHNVLPEANKVELETLLEKDEETIDTELTTYINKHFAARAKSMGEEWYTIAATVYLHTIDELWGRHLTNIDHLREGINLRGYAQMDPLVEYKKESFRLFEELMQTIDEEFTKRIFNVQLVPPQGISTLSVVEHKSISSKHAHLDEAARAKLAKKHAKHSGKRK
jgi:preprotein translocase subunit SecA